MRSPTFVRMDEVRIRYIQPADNKELAIIVRQCLAEFGVNRPGTVFFDPSTDHLFELFQQTRSRYFTALINDTIVGGAGVYPSPGLPEDTCELVKMYLLPPARGKGLGKTLIEKCLDSARELGYKGVYLETMAELRRAMAVYEQFGFRFLHGPMGNTGHFGCDVWMWMDLGT